ncbi:MAG: response regulator [Rhodospirillales bacterium]
MADLRTILYVEDEPDIQAIAELSLQVVGGFEVTLCGSGAEALEKAPAIDPDLILLDVMMPGMDGPETLAKMREIDALKNKPVVFLTAKTGADDIDRLKALGALEVVAKPFDPMELPDRIRTIWAAHTG